jgi:hypothetical protein
LELDQPEANSIRIRNTSSLEELPSYTTLSHYWGTAQFLKLENRTMQQLYDGVAISYLPKIFQHATYVARKFGANYLWIDSLCILQDCKEDWASESSLMGEIYKGSLCNIAATGTANANDSFLFKSRVDENGPCIIKTKCTDTEKYADIGYTPFPNQELHLEAASWAHLPHENNQLLFRRGWVVQERFLAPRVLHFGSEYAFWECHTTAASEIYPAGMPDSLVVTNPKIHWFRDLTDPTRDAYIYWNKAVAAYSGCLLTKESYKLVAISGVAKDLV